MKLLDAITYTFNRFTNRREGKDRWQFLHPIGEIQGDCEDFSLTVMREHYVTRRRAILALLLGQAKLWYTLTTNGQPHAVGQIGPYYFDNWGRLAHASKQDMHHINQRSWSRFSRRQILMKLYGKRTMAWVYLTLYLLGAGAILTLWGISS